MTDMAATSDMRPCFFHSRDISVVVSASSLEKHFLIPLLRECGHFASDVVVAHGSHLLSSDKEDRKFFDALKSRFQSHQKTATTCRYVFVEYDVRCPPPLRRLVSGTTETDQKRPHENPVAVHNTARRVGFDALKRSRSARLGSGAEKTWVLFLDGDEVPDGKAIATWWAHQRILDATDRSRACKLSNYWYFLRPNLRADALEDSAILVREDAVTDAAIADANPRERDGILALSSVRYGGGLNPESTLRNVLGVDGKAMIHHFSWVRSREDMLRKVTTWGHRRDRPWRELLEHAWAMMDRQGRHPPRDFVHGYRLVQVSDAEVSAFCDDLGFADRLRDDVQ